MPTIFVEQRVLDNITESEIRKIIDSSATVEKFQRLQQYYEGEHAILNRRAVDSTAPNNKLVFNFPQHVTNTTTGYFMGKPVIYSSDNAEYHALIQDIYDYNDEQDHNAELAKGASIKGVADEMLYFDEECRLRISKLEPEAITYITSTTSDQPSAAVRRWVTYDFEGTQIEKVEFWTWTEVWRFEARGGRQLVLTGVEEHYWEDVPFVEYPNNSEYRGDYEGILSLVDAYNKVQSNTANVFEYNDEALLKIHGLGDVTSQDVKEMKEKGSIILEEDGDIDWLLKQLNDSALENYKDRLFTDMHIAANVPNMNDESFGNNVSGIAADYKLWGMEQVAAGKERKFKKGLQRRAELITRMLNKIHGTAYDYRDLQMQFRRNKPQSLLEWAQILTMLSGDLSLQTRLAQLPFVDNVAEEMERIGQEKKDSRIEFGGYDQLTEALHKHEAETSPEEKVEPDG